MIIFTLNHHSFLLERIEEEISMCCGNRTELWLRKCANTSLSGILSPRSQQYAVNSFSLAELLRLQNDIISIKWNLWKLAIYVINSLLFSRSFKWKSATCFRVSVNGKSFIETFKLQSSEVKQKCLWQAQFEILTVNGKIYFYIHSECKILKVFGKAVRCKSSACTHSWWRFIWRHEHTWGWQKNLCDKDGTLGQR